MTEKMKRDDLEAVVALVDADLEAFYTECGGIEPDMAQVLRHLFGAKAGAEDALGPLAVNRATLAAHVTSTEDLDAREDEVSRMIIGWLDGFIVGMRYAEDLAKPKPKSKLETL